uniref:Uncharacterized protein n=1 Tax=Anguilla anguilla TaxID=7936 RepID=A0A0E9S3Q8_ANGAN
MCSAFLQRLSHKGALQYRFTTCRCIISKASFEQPWFAAC